MIACFQIDGLLLGSFMYRYDGFRGFDVFVQLATASNELGARSAPKQSHWGPFCACASQATGAQRGLRACPASTTAELAASR